MQGKNFESLFIGKGKARDSFSVGNVKSIAFGRSTAGKGKGVSQQRFLRNNRLDSLAMFSDSDRDFVVNGLDCYPFDKDQHGVITKLRNLVTGRGWKEDEEIYAQRPSFADEVQQHNVEARQMEEEDLLEARRKRKLEVEEHNAKVRAEEDRMRKAQEERMRKAADEMREEDDEELDEEEMKRKVFADARRQSKELQRQVSAEEKRKLEERKRFYYEQGKRGEPSKSYNEVAREWMAKAAVDRPSEYKLLKGELKELKPEQYEQLKDMNPSRAYKYLREEAKWLEPDVKKYGALLKEIKKQMPVQTKEQEEAEVMAAKMKQNMYLSNKKSRHLGESVSGALSAVKGKVGRFASRKTAYLFEDPVTRAGYKREDLQRKLDKEVEKAMKVGVTRSEIGKIAEEAKGMPKIQATLIREKRHILAKEKENKLMQLEAQKIEMKRLQEYGKFKIAESKMNKSLVPHNFAFQVAKGNKWNKPRTYGGMGSKNYLGRTNIGIGSVSVDELWGKKNDSLFTMQGGRYDPDAEKFAYVRNPMSMTRKTDKVDSGNSLMFGSVSMPPLTKRKGQQYPTGFPLSGYDRVYRGKGRMIKRGRPRIKKDRDSLFGGSSLFSKQKKYTGKYPWTYM